MALKFINVVKVVQVNASATTPQDIADHIDHCETLRAKAEAARAKIKKLQAEVTPYSEAMAKLATMITQHTDATGIDKLQEVTLFGEKAGAKAGKKTLTRTVTSQKLARKLLTEAVYDQTATIALKVLDQYLTQAEKETLLTESYGDRGVTLVPKPKNG